MIEEAVKKIEEVLQTDPKKEALNYSHQCFQWLGKLEPSYSEAQELAARCQHFRRWDIPRSDYPMDKKGIINGESSFTPTKQKKRLKF